MKKSFSVNIGYRLFNIDEDAYERLQLYLDHVKAKLNAEGSDEVIKDIEIRIAELLGSRMTPSKEGVVLADIEFVISELGEPEQIEDFSEGSEDKKQDARQDRRLFRDPDQRIFGGVCSGLAAFFDVESLWVRIAFVVLFMIGGSGLLIYLILWLVVPVAATSAEKLQMKGRKVNVHNLSDRVRDEFDHVRTSFTSRKGRPAGHARAARSGGSVIESDAFKTLMYIFGAIGGFFLIAFSLMFLAGFSLAFFADISYLIHSHDFGVSASLFDMIFFITTNPFTGWLSVLSILFFIGIPLISMIIFGLKLIFRFHFPLKWYNRIASSLWGISFVALAALVIYHVVYFSNSTNEGKTILVPKSDAVVELSLASVAPGFNKQNGDKWNHWYFTDNKGVLQMIAQPDIEIEPELSDSVIRVEAHLRNSGKRSTLSYNYWVPRVQDSTKIIIPGWLPSEAGDFHSADIEIFVPVGTRLSLTPEMRQMLHNQDELDKVLLTTGDFVMTADGLRPAPANNVVK